MAALPQLPVCAPCSSMGLSVAGLLSLSGHRRFVHPGRRNVPAATERAERTHGGARRIGTAGIQLVPCNEQLPVRIQYVCQRDRTSLIRLLREIPRTDERIDLSLQFDD